MSALVGFNRRGATTPRKLASPSEAARRAAEEKGAATVDGEQRIVLVDLHDSKEDAPYDTAVPVGEPIFEAMPASVLIEGFAPFETSTVKIELRNRDSVARRACIMPPENHCFSLSAPQRPEHKVAPGMRLSYTLSFKASELREYRCDLLCVTEREKFIIPVRATPPRARVELPAHIDFGTRTVRQRAEYPFVLRNTGATPARFAFDARAPFSFEPREGELGVGELRLVTACFAPRLRGAYAETASLLLDGGASATPIALGGHADDADVHLDVTSVDMRPTYVRLSSVRTVRICNNSDEPVSFHWKRFATEEEDTAFRRRRIEQLEADESTREDAAVAALLEKKKSNAQKADSSNPTSESVEKGAEGKQGDENEDDDAEAAELRAAKVHAALTRRFRKLYEEVEGDPLSFSDAQFQVEPVSGQVWPRGVVEVAVTFSPLSAQRCMSTAYCEVSGAQDRLTLLMEGVGLGPKASFSLDVLDVGEVFVNAVHRYSVLLQNIGEIPARFKRQPPASGELSRVVFEPSQGVLGVVKSAGDEKGPQVEDDRSSPSSTELTVHLCSPVLGEFVEKVEWALEGMQQPLVLLVRGRVIAPRFDFEPSALDFGIVSHGFANTRTLKLTNTALVPMFYTLRVPQDGEATAQHEFTIEPTTGQLMPRESVTVAVTLRSETTQSYAYSLVMDLRGVGESVWSLPVRAQCVAPDIVAGISALAFDTCFIRHASTLILPLSNSSTLPARFELRVPDEDASGSVATVVFDPSEGVVEPQSTLEVHVTVTPFRLGRISLPTHLVVPGKPAPALLDLSCVCSGPRVALSADKLDWGTVTVLNPLEKRLTLRNDSPIPARFTAFVHRAGSPFRVIPAEGVVAPDATFDLTVTACLEDSVSFRDELHILVREGENLSVALRASGEGSTIVCTTPLDVLDLGTAFAGCKVTRQFTLENKGLRAQLLTWAFIDPATEAAAREKKAKKLGQQQQQQQQPSTDSKAKGDEAKKSAAEDGDALPRPQLFSISPAKLLLQPRTAAVFTVEACAPSPQAVIEKWECSTLIANDRQARLALGSQLRAEFVAPLLSFSAERLEFCYMHDPIRGAAAIEPQAKTLEMTNLTPLPLVFWLRCAPPFSVDCLEFDLQPRETARVQVTFAPELRVERQSEVLRAQLSVQYRDHRQRDKVALEAEMCFPNLRLSHKAVDFGAIPAGARKRQLVTLSNCSKLPVRYSWAFFEPAAPSAVPPNAAFDIMPIRGLLQPGESEEAEFSFTSELAAPVRAQAVCEVEGGPDYELPLTGEAAALRFELEQTSLDFGAVALGQHAERTLVLRNLGKVPLDFALSGGFVRGLQLFKVQPASGRVEGRGRLKLAFRFCADVPDCVEGHFALRVASFDPVDVLLRGQAVYPQLALSLPRVENARRAALLEAADAAVAANRQLEMQREQEHQQRVQRGRESAAPAAAAAAAGPGPASPKGALLGPGSARPQSRSSEVTVASAESETRRSLASARSTGSSARRAMEEKFVPMPAASFDRETEADRLGFLAHLTSGDAPASAPFFISAHVCDMGYVVAGTGRSRTFTVRNVGRDAVILEMPKALLQGSGFAMEPTKLPRLSSGESVEITVSVDSAGRTEGAMTLDLPLTPKGGPAVLMQLRAEVVVPDVWVSQASLDFGSVLLGQRRELSVLLRNDKPVACEWSVMKPQPTKTSGPQASKHHADPAAFDCQPRGGTLAPGARCIISLSFTPKAAREEPFGAAFPIAIAHNPRGLRLACRGQALQRVLRLEPAALEFPPLMPGQRSEALQVALVNAGAVDLEVFCAELDAQHRDEEAQLAAHPELFTAGVAALFPRAPGKGLSRLRAHSSLPPSIATGPQIAAEAAAAAARPLVEVCRNVLVAGPPSAGTSSIAASVARLLGLDAVEAVFSLDEAASWIDRNLQHAPALAALAGEWAAARSRAPAEPFPPNLFGRALAAFILQPRANADAAAAGQADGNAQAGKPVADDEPTTPRAPGTGPPAWPRRQGARRSQRFSDGLVIDGLECALLASAAAAAQAIAEAWTVLRNVDSSIRDPNLNSLHVVTLSASAATCAQRLEARKAALQAELQRPEAVALAKRFKPLAPKDLAKLKPDKLAEYQQAADAMQRREGTEAQLQMLQSATARRVGDYARIAEETAAGIAALRAEPWVLATTLEVDGKTADEVDAPLAALLALDPPYVSAQPVDPDWVPPPRTLELVRAPSARPPKPAQQVLRLSEGARFVIAAGARVLLSVEALSDKAGTWTQDLSFEIVGDGAGRAHTLACKGVCGLPELSGDPRSVFMRRVKSRKGKGVVQRQFVTDEGVFEFGPLLVGRRGVDLSVPVAAWSAEQRALLKKSQCETLRLANTGLFPCVVELSLESESKAPELQPTLSPEPEQKKAKPAATKGKAPTPPPAAVAPANAPFVIEPRTVEVPVGGVGELSVWALPQSVGKISDAILVRVKHQPQPLRFELRCEGCRPRVELSTSRLVFARLLGGKSETRDLELKNPTSLPVAWTLALGPPLAAPSPPLQPKGGAKDAKKTKEAPSAPTAAPQLQQASEPAAAADALLPKELSVSPATRGIIPPLSSQQLRVTYAAGEPRVIAHSLAVEVSDAEGALGAPAESLPLVVEGESFKVDVAVGLPEGGLDFGVVRVGEEAVRTVSLSNQGKYSASFKIAVAGKQRALLQQVISISPEAAEIAPGARQEVTMRFKSSAAVSLTQNQDIRLSLLEAQSQVVVSTQPLKLSGKAVFSQFRVVPSRSVQFGPLQVGSSRSKKVDIFNDGVFPLEFRFAPASEAEALKAAAAPGEVKGAGDARASSAKGGKDAGEEKKKDAGGKKPSAATGKGAKGGAAEPAEESLSVGPFQVTPQSGAVPPGGSVSVTVTFSATQPTASIEALLLAVSNRDPADGDGPLEYELSGEGCTPGINTSNLEEVFEEQEILRKADSRKVQRDVFLLEERALVFAPVIVGSEQRRTQRVRLHNPSKIACDVKVTVKADGAGAGALPGDRPAFSVEPAAVHIPSHESRYLEIAFAPRALQSYKATVEAAVEGGIDPASRLLAFEVRGEGTLPFLSVSSPTVRDAESGAAVMDLGRVLCSRQRSATLVLSNPGQVAATARFQWAGTPHAALTCDAVGRLLTVEAGTTALVGVSFAPTEEGALQGELRVSVLQNPFDSLRVLVRGVAFQQDVSVEDADDESGSLDFGDLTPGENRDKVVTLVNRSDHLFRFNWARLPQLAALQMSPAEGLLQPRSQKQITLRLGGDKPVVLRREIAACQMTKVRYASDNRADWDSNSGAPEPPLELLEEKKPEPVKGGKPASAAASKGAASKKPAEAAAAPEADSGSVQVTVSGVLDYARFECSVKNVAFKPTMMMQSRTFSFAVRNTGERELRFAWRSAGVFSVEPQMGAIAAKSEFEFVAKFAPLDAGECSEIVNCSMEGLNPANAPLQLHMCGTATRPRCHLELVPSDYLTSGRRPAEMPGPDGSVTGLPPSFRVIEFVSLGVHVRNTKRFFVHNPTDSPFEYQWTCLTPQVHQFRCLTPSGIVAAGKKTEMIFEFTPEQDRLLESFWQFSIDDGAAAASATALTTPFLLVGRVSEPDVSLDRPHINFQAIRVGHKQREVVHLVNREHIPFAFAVDQSALSGTALSVEPLQGVVPPDSKLVVQLQFWPRSEHELNVTVPFVFRNKSGRVALNAKGEGYHVQARLEVRNDESSAEVPPSPHVAPLGFGLVYLNEKCTKTVAVQNTSKYPIDFVWQLPQEAVGVLRVTPANGALKRGQRQLCEVAVEAANAAKLDAVPLTCVLANGCIKYQLAVSAQVRRPNVEFSTAQVDFGPCFVGSPVTKALIVTSHETERHVSIDVAGGEAAREHLEVRASALVLAPGQRIEVPLVFCAQETRAYRDEVRFDLNGGLHKVGVAVTGQGTPLKVELLDGEVPAALDFGRLRVGQTAVQRLKLVNRSKRAVSLRLCPDAADLCARFGFSATPAFDSAVTLKPRETLAVEIAARAPEPFAPMKRAVFMELRGAEAKSEAGAGEARALQRRLQLAELSASCYAVGLRLDTESLMFGSVVMKSSSTKVVALENVGDSPLRFRWADGDWRRDFSISPTSGSVAPHSIAHLEVTFQPQRAAADVNYSKIRCAVEGAPGVSDLYLTLSGESQAPSAADSPELKFACPVRTRATQSVVLKNPTNTAWVLHPSFDHQFWSGAASIEVPPRQQVPYELVYTPLTTAEHRATLFVPLPNGQASVFRLVGTAAPPSPESQLQRQVLCKQTVVETLRVRNWLSQAQHFAVQIEPASSPLVQISGVDTLDVPPQGERAYKLTFKALKPGTTKVAIKFVAQGSNEYVHHLVEFIAGAPLVEELPFVLSTALRQKVVKHVRIVNPFPDRAATVSGFMCEPECREVFVPTPLQVSAGSEVLVPVSFRPLIADGGKERTVTLTLSSEELGAFCYRVRLQVVQEDAAAPAASASPVAAAFAADKTLRFDTSLGCELTQTVRFQSLATVPAKYDFKLPAGSPFSLVGPASVQAPAAAADSDGVEVAVQVRYDPVAVGDSREVLLATSPIGGDFRILLIGSCSAPKPLGPVAVASSAGATIQFRNPSDAPQDFTFSVDNAAFTLAKKSEKIAPKKVATIAVSFKGAGDETGKLLIAGCGTQWVFYLRGAK